jgi:hypothetical protein
MASQRSTSVLLPTVFTRVLTGWLRMEPASKGVCTLHLRMGLNMWDEIHESPCRRDTSNQRVLNSARRALGHIHNTRHGAKE